MLPDTRQRYASLTQGHFQPAEVTLELSAAVSSYTRRVAPGTGGPS